MFLSNLCYCNDNSIREGTRRSALCSCAGYVSNEDVLCIYTGFEGSPGYGHIFDYNLTHEFKLVRDYIAGGKGSGRNSNAELPGNLENCMSTP